MTPPGDPSPDQKKPPIDDLNDDQTAPQPVWSYRGYRLRGSDFTTAMVHLFRAEVQRANVWRQRLDSTTNWAVLTTGAVLSIISASSETPHLVILLNLLLVTVFLVIEARRYRYYELWSYRVRLMETDFFAPMLVPPFQPSPEWAEALAEHLLQPAFPISSLEAIGRRLRRNYIWIYLIIAIAWLTHLWLKPERARTWQEFITHAGFQGIRGEFPLSIGLVIILTFILIGLLTARMQHAAGEVLPRFASQAVPVGPDGETRSAEKPASEAQAWFRPAYRRRQLMTMIITDHAKAISDRIFSDMRRGVTALPGTGMYTGQEHTVLLVALTVTEVPHLRSLVNDIDPKAFVIVMPAQEVFGTGFMPLHQED
jgi:uncharacterized membrane protein